MRISGGDFAMFCLAGAIACVLWLLERSPWTVCLCLLGMFLFLVFPIWHLPWIKKSKSRRVAAEIILAVAIIWIGYELFPLRHGNLARRIEGRPTDPVFPYHAGKPKLDVWYTNTGEKPIRNARIAGEIRIVPVTITEDEMFADFKQKASFVPTENEIAPNAPEGFKTLYGREEIVDGDIALLSGPAPQKKLCAVAAFLWQDDTGQYESDLCGCMEPNRNPGAIPPFGYSKGHNGTWKTN